MITGNPNQQTGVPIEHYKQIFETSDPQLLADRSAIPYDGEKFTIHLMTRTIYLYWPEMKAIFADTEAETSAYIRILVSRLVLEGSIIPSRGEFKAYAEMPWGEVYLRQFTGRCIMRLAGSFGHNLEGFKKSCESLNGTPAGVGDASYDIKFMDGLTVRLILWEADDEFPAAAQVLFSDNFPSAFSAEDIAYVGDILINAMKGRW